MYTTAGYIVYTTLAVLIFLYLGYCLRGLAIKFDKPHNWLAWIPIVRFYLAAEIVDGGIGWFLLMICPVVQIVAFLIYFMKLARKCGMHWAYGLLLLVPVLQFVMLWIFAFSEAPPPKEPEGEIAPQPQ